MISLDESEMLLQIISTMKDQISKLESKYSKGQINEALPIKKSFLKLQKQISDMMEAGKK